MNDGTQRLAPLAKWVVLILSLYGCQGVQSDYSLLPKASPGATEVLLLQSNVNCQFVVDGKPVIAGKYVRILVDERSHQVVCKPEGYRAKEEYVQPPFNRRHPIGFTFLLEDRLAQEGQGNIAEGGQAPAALPSDVDAPPTMRSAPKKNVYGLVIGIEQYRENLPKADFAAHDARVVGEYLTSVMGYPEENVVVRINGKAAKADLEKYLEAWLPNNVEKDGSVFIYFSGHGAPNIKSGDAYLVPYDGDPTFVDKTGYPLKRLYAALEKLSAKEITVVLDSCFSGAGGRSVLAQGAKPMVLSVENAVLAGGRTVVLAASSSEQISSAYIEKGHGLLTYFFLKGLRGEGDLNKDGTVEMTELYEYVKPNVQKVARKGYNNEQTPQLLASPDILQKGGGRLVEGLVP